MSSRDWRLAWLAAVAAILMRVVFSERRGFWLDEYYTLRAVQMGLGELVRDRLSMGHSPLYFFYARLGLLAGQQEWALRLTSALAAGATVLFTTGLIGALGLRRILTAFWVLAIFHPYWINAGTEFRYMMPLVALAALACWTAVRFVESRGPGPGIACALTVALLLSLHASAFFVTAALFCFLLWEGGGLRQAWKRAWPVLAGMLLSLPLFISVSSQKIVEKKAGHISYKDLWEALTDTVFGDHYLWPELFDINHSFLLAPILGLIAAAVWIARRELLAQGRRRAWRLLFLLLVSIPLADLLVSKFLGHSVGPARYLASWSIPATICLALAWHGARSAWGRRAFRGALVLIVLVQAAGAALDLGDLHRESIQWIIRNHDGRERVLVSTSAMNRIAFQYLKFPHPEQVVDLVMGEERGNRNATKRRLQEILARDTRGFILLYHDKNKVDDAAQDLQKEGFFQALKQWKLCRAVTLMAYIRDARELPWLQSLPEPRKPWGPASGMH